MLHLAPLSASCWRRITTRSHLKVSFAAPATTSAFNFVFLVKVLGTIAFIVAVILIVGSVVLAIVSRTTRFLLVIVEIRRFFCSVVIECGGCCRRRELCL